MTIHQLIFPNIELGKKIVEKWFKAYSGDLEVDKT